MRKGLLFNFFFCSFIFLFDGAIFAQSALFVSPKDVRIETEQNSPFEIPEGFHLYIRKKPGIESILLTETTKDPLGKSDNYAYRALEYNPINGDEIRILNGQKLDSENSRYSLVDSTPEVDAEFGEAFHIYIPSTIQFGYPWTRNGMITVGRGTFINIRSFSKKYADYTGDFFDNSFMFDLGTKKVEKKPLTIKINKMEEIKSENNVAETEVVVEKPLEKEPEKEVELNLEKDVEPVSEIVEETVVEVISEPEKKETVILTDAYSPHASEEFGKFAEFVTYSKGPETIVSDIMEALRAISPKDSCDVVFAIDATGSMKDDIEQLRNEWIPELIKGVEEFKSLRLGLLLYRDYGDNFKYNGLPVRFFNFTNDVDIFARYLNAFEIKGKEGGDIPEAVYEALYGSMAFYNWNPDASKKIILIGDAEPHPTPRGTKKYTKELVLKMAAEKDISIDAIITPDDKTARGR